MTVVLEHCVYTGMEHCHDKGMEHFDYRPKEHCAEKAWCIVMTIGIEHCDERGTGTL